jgi:hypothetical protein
MKKILFFLLLTLPVLAAQPSYKIALLKYNGAVTGMLTWKHPCPT